MVDSVLLCMGYTCLCGEKVTVYRIETNGAVVNRIAGITVTCKSGHARVVTIDQLATLDHWVEGIEDEQELATCT